MRPHSQGRETIAPSCGHGRTAAQEKRHIRTQPTGQVMKFLMGQFQIPKSVESKQSNRGIAAPAAQTGGGGNPFADFDVAAAGQGHLLLEQPGRPVRQILGSGRHLRVVAPDTQGSSRQGGDIDGIIEIDGLENRLDIMESIGALPDDIQTQIDFGAG
jgi:hypothetical protein